MESYAIFPHCALFPDGTPLSRGSDGRFGLRRFRAKLTPNRVWHSPRFHSRPATLLRAPFCPFHTVPPCFFFPLPLK